MSCNFEKDFCNWDVRSFSSLKWVRTSQENISTSKPLEGPGRDHSTNFASGTYNPHSTSSLQSLYINAFFSGNMTLI